MGAMTLRASEGFGGNQVLLEQLVSAVRDREA